MTLIVTTHGPSTISEEDHVDTKQLLQDGESFTLGAKQDINRVRSLVAEYLALQDRITKGEALLKQLKEEARELEWVKLPAAMTENGVKRIERDDGSAVEVVSEVTGSIPEKNLPQAVQWLRENGHGGIVQQTIFTSFRKGEEASALRAKQALVAAGCDYVEKATVNHMTLKAWAREMVSSGAALPTELLGLFIGQRAKIKLPKEK